MPKLDFGSVLTLIVAVFVLLLFLICMAIKLKTDLMNKLTSASMYETPTWTEVSDNG